MADSQRSRDHERTAPLPDEPTAVTAPVVRLPGKQRSARVPFEPTDFEATEQSTFVLGVSEIIALVRPRKYANPSFSCSILNTGPGMVSARWDGENAVFGAVDCALIPPGMGYAEAITQRMSIAADGLGATVSVSCEPFYG
jgi:hypothetical protein